MLVVAVYFEGSLVFKPDTLKIGFFTLLPEGEALPYAADSPESLRWKRVKGPVESPAITLPGAYYAGGAARDFAEIFANSVGLPYFGLLHDGKSYRGEPFLTQRQIL